jgi:hypothetical protein
MRPLDPAKFLAETLKPYAVGERPGLPSLLDRYLLDAADADDAAIGRRLREVKALWDKNFNHSRYGKLAKALSDEHDDAELTLLDPGERARLADAAEREAEEAGRKATAALADWRKVLAEHIARGGLTPNSRSLLERIAKGAGIAPQLVKAELDRAPVAAPPKLMPSEARDQIRRSLGDLAREVGEERMALSLYHGLGLDGITADLGKVQRRYDEVAEANGKRAIGPTATAYKTLLANAKLHLLDADPRAYIEGLVLDIETGMEFEAARVATDGVIDPVEAESLLQSAIRRGLTPELARRVVTQLARQNDAIVETGAVVDYVACPACNTPHARPSAPKTCQHCGTALFVICPAEGCGATNDATTLRCSTCQTDLQKFAEATRRLRVLPTAVEEGRIGWAASELQEIMRVLGAAAIPADLKAHVDRALAAAQAGWAQAEAAISSRRLYAARSALQQLVKTAADVPGPTGERPAARAEEVDRRLREVDAVLVRARAASGLEREAALVAAVRLAEDCGEAASALAAIAPEPPAAVRAQFGPGGLTVEWKASGSPGARYRVRRVDVRTSESTEIALVDATRCDDRAAPSGAVVRYEITTLRGQAASASAASSPLLVAREVEDVACSDADGEVRISWRTVPASARVIVERTDESTREQKPIGADRTGLVDRDVRNGERYAYRITIEYSGLDGEVKRTAGITIYGQPAAPPEGIEELRIRTAPGGALIEFDRPPTGTVTIVRCESEPSLSAGDALDPGALAGLGRILRASSNGAHDDVASGVCWYLPVTVAGGTAIAGRAVRHLALPGIENVTVAARTGQVKVTWEWPEGVRIAKVIWRRDRQPSGPDDPEAESAWVRLSSYRDNGGFSVESRGPEPVFIGVTPGIRVDGELVAGTTLAKGSRASIRMASKSDLRYAVRRAGLRKRRLEVQVDVPQGVTAPSLVLVARNGDLLPRTAGEGDVLARLGGDEPLSSSIDLSGRSFPFAVRLFLESSSSAAAFQLLDPGPDELLLR